jgi:hypothetical protein
MGQFHSFAKSRFMRASIPDASERIPTINKLIVFRHKHTAHRSMDAPRDADTDELQWVHARSLSTLGGRLFTPKPDTPVPPPANVTTVDDLEAWSRPRYGHAYVTFQIFDDTRREYVDFALERDHPRIIQEAYALIERLIITR